MSCTELYGLTKDRCYCIGEVHNAWRGAMSVWMYLEEKYLPPYRPSWVVHGDTYKCSRCSAGMIPSDKNPMDEIWQLVKSDKLCLADKIVLASTFDNALAGVKEIEPLLIAFRTFEGTTSLKEQADLIEQAIKEDPELVAIGWNQTSVNADTWASENYDEETEEYSGYNLSTGTRHWFVIEELNKR